MTVDSVSGVQSAPGVATATRSQGGTVDRHSVRSLRILCAVTGVLLFPQIAGAALINLQSLLLLRNAGSYSSHLAMLEGPLRTAASWTGGAAPHRALGSLYLAVGQPRLAATWLKQVLERHPDDRMASLALGDILASLGDTPGALQQWRAARVSALYLATSGLTYRTFGHQLTQDQRRALAAQLWPEWSNAWFELGIAEMARGDSSSARAAAIDAFERALALATWTPASSPYTSEYWAHYYSGVLLFNASRFEQAYDHFRRCLETALTAPFDQSDLEVASLHRRAGLTSLMAGEHDRAVRHLTQVIALSGHDPEAEQWLEQARRGGS